MRTLLATVLLLLATQSIRGSVAIDATASGDRSTASTTTATPAFSTSSGNELLLAFIATDYLSGANTTVRSVSGAGLTWVLVVRANAQRGTSEIWRAFAPTRLSNVAVTATLSQSVVSSITVMSFTGVDTSGTNGSGAIGATGSNNGSSGAPTATLVTTRSNSWVFGVGNDFDNAIARTPGANQTLVHQYLAPVGDTYWVQRQNQPTPASGTTVTINDTAPTTDRYNLSICEILAAPGGTQTWSISGTISPASAGNGAVLMLSGTSSGAVTADSSGNYSFGNLINGAYMITPVKSGFTFSPTNQAVTLNGGNASGINFTATAVPTWSISGSVSPAASGSGTLLNLTGTTTAMATADASGNYSFTGLSNGTYTVTPVKSGFTFTPVTQMVTIAGANVTGINFTAQGTPPTLNYPNLSDIIPTAKMSIVGTGNSRMFQYTHDTFNGGPGPLVIQPVFNAASGNYQGTQYIYSLSSSGVWSLAKQIPVAGVFIFDSDHGHFHFPFVSYGLYTVAANGGPGTPVVTSGKVSFCINDSFIYDPTLPNAGALGNLGSCSDPTSLRGLDIGAVDEYDQTDAGQSISLANVPDGTYWLRALVDPNNYLAESDKTNNETDVKLTITGNTLQVLQTVIPTLNVPPAITLTAPLNGAALSGTVQLTASTGTTSGVQFLIDGQAFGGIVSSSIAWDTTTAANGTHWLAVQTTDPTGVIGTSAVALVTVSNNVTVLPTVQLTSPTAGSVLFSTVSLYATASGSQPIVSVAFFVDSAPVGSPVTAPPYMISWDTTQVADGQHVITVSATDSLGNVGNSTPVTVSVDNSHPAKLIGKDVSISVDGQGVMTTPSFSTLTAGDLVLAFVGYDGPSNTAQTATVSGAGLTWTLLERSNTESGTSEIWSARATGVLSGVTVTAQPGVGNYHGSLTVIAFTNAAGTSVVGRTGALSGAPDIPLPGVIAGDWVFAAGNDWDNAVARSPVTGQVLVHQRLDTQTGDTYWVQSTAAPSTATGVVDIHDTSPTTDRWNYAAVEIVATHQ